MFQAAYGLVKFKMIPQPTFRGSRCISIKAFVSFEAHPLMMMTPRQWWYNNNDTH